MADLPIPLEGELADELVGALDVEGKIPRAIQELGQIKDRDVLAIDGPEGLRGRQLEPLGARIDHAEAIEATSRGEQSVDVVVAWWSAFRGVDAGEMRAADRLLRPGGRLIVVHDYGRDDVSRLRGDLPEYSMWSRREGPFLTAGFRIRVLHCWWTFPSINQARDFLERAFGAIGRDVGARLTRPRLSYNVAVYHRHRGEGDSA